MCLGFCSSVTYVAMSSSDSPRPNHVPYHVRNGTMMKSAATMISQMLDGRRDFCPARTSAFPPFGFTNSFSICGDDLTTEDTEEARRERHGPDKGWREQIAKLHFAPSRRRNSKIILIQARRGFAACTWLFY